MTFQSIYKDVDYRKYSSETKRQSQPDPALLFDN
jgi:hypothetical protein